MLRVELQELVHAVEEEGVVGHLGEALEAVGGEELEGAAVLLQDAGGERHVRGADLGGVPLQQRVRPHHGPEVPHHGEQVRGGQEDLGPDQGIILREA